VRKTFTFTKSFPIRALGPGLAVLTGETGQNQASFRRIMFS